MGTKQPPGRDCEAAGAGWQNRQSRCRQTGRFVTMMLPLYIGGKGPRTRRPLPPNRTPCGAESRRSGIGKKRPKRDWEKSREAGLGKSGRGGIGKSSRRDGKQGDAGWRKAGPGLKSGRAGWQKQAEPLPSDLTAGNGNGERAREKALHVVQGLLKSSRRLPIFPGRLQPSIVGV